jgi:hypothetical protein
MNFSQAEMVDMIYVLGASDKNALLAKRQYQERYPERRQPERKIFEKLMERFQRTGSVAYNKNTRKERVLTEENQLNVLLTVAENPHIGQRSISLEVDVERRTVQRILKAHKMHPYHIQLFQELFPEDYQRRLEFCLCVITEEMNKEILLIWCYLEMNLRFIGTEVSIDTIFIIIPRKNLIL